MHEDKCAKTATLKKLIAGRKFQELDRKFRQELIAIDGAVIVDYDGKILAVGIAYDRKTKKHSCIVEEIEHESIYKTYNFLQNSTYSFQTQLEGVFFMSCNCEKPSDETAVAFIHIVVRGKPEEALFAVHEGVLESRTKSKKGYGCDFIYIVIQVNSTFLNLRA